MGFGILIIPNRKLYVIVTNMVLAPARSPPTTGLEYTQWFWCLCSDHANYKGIQKIYYIMALLLPMFSNYIIKTHIMALLLTMFSNYILEPHR